MVIPITSGQSHAALDGNVQECLSIVKEVAHQARHCRVALLLVAPDPGLIRRDLAGQIRAVVIAPNARPDKFEPEDRAAAGPSDGSSSSSRTKKDANVLEHDEASRWEALAGHSCLVVEHHPGGLRLLAASIDDTQLEGRGSCLMKGQHCQMLWRIFFP
jgi:hypothetical protein